MAEQDQTKSNAEKQITTRKNTANKKLSKPGSKNHAKRGRPRNVRVTTLAVRIMDWVNRNVRGDQYLEVSYKNIADRVLSNSESVRKAIATLAQKKWMQKMDMPGGRGNTVVPMRVTDLGRQILLSDKVRPLLVKSSK